MLALSVTALLVLSLPSILSFPLPAGPRSSPTSDYAPFDSSFRLVWSDEFNATDGSAPDPSVWNFETGGGGFGNHELEVYTSRRNNSFIQDGRLVIQALKEAYMDHNYTSARIDTQGKVEVLYGLIAARARISMFDGFWPAFWLLGSANDRVSWPRCGEMDIMEQVNGQGTGGQDDTLQFGTLHYNQYGENSTKVNHESTGATITAKKGHYWGDESATLNTLPHCQAAIPTSTAAATLRPLRIPPCSWPHPLLPPVCRFHLYQALWTNTSYTFMVDDLAYNTIDLTSDVKYSSFTDPSNPFFFIVNLAMGGDFPKRVPEQGFPARLELDWIRVWQQGEMGEVKAPQQAERERVGDIGEGQRQRVRDTSGLRARALHKHERV